MNRFVSVPLLFAIVLQIWACSAQSGSDGSGAATDEFGDASICGTYVMSSTLKPYVKFGGPQVGSGKLLFDGHGNVSGQGVNFGVASDLKGTYHVDPDGTGTIEYTATAPSNAVNRGGLRFRIINADEVEFQSKDSANKDWASAATVTESKDNGVVGTLRRVPQ